MDDMQHRRNDHIVVVALHDYIQLPKLERLPQAAARVAELFARLGFAAASDELMRDGRWLALTAGLEGWLLRGRRLVLYWGGHGVHDGDVYYLLATDSPPRPANTNAVQAATLGQILARSDVDEILLIIDACGSGGGASQVTRAFERAVAGVERPDGSSPGLAVITSARRFRQARELALSDAIVRVLDEGPPAGPERGMWGPRDRLISPNALAAAVSHDLGEAGLSADFSSCGIYGNFIPNPRFRPDVPDVELASRRRRDAFVPQDVQEHFMLKFRGVEQPSDHGWFFAGRHTALRHLSSWLATATSGMYTVTGAPGTGKSAILGCIAVLSEPQYRDNVAQAGLLASMQADAIPPAGSIDVGVHAKNKTLLDCVAELADALGLQAPDGLWSSAGEFVAAVESLVRSRVRKAAELQRMSAEAFLQDDASLQTALADGRSLTVLVDALDEAVDKDVATIATDLLRALAMTPLVRVLVGTRPNRGPLGTKGSPLLRALAPDRCVVLGSGTFVEYGDFDQFAGPGTHLEIVSASSSAQDIAQYARRRLTATNSVYRDDTAEVARISDLVAVRSDGVFLAARLLTRALAGLPVAYPHDAPTVDVITKLSVTEMFEADLRRFGDEATRASGLLQPLAWAEGAGLPRDRVWLAVANALSSSSSPYTTADLDWLMDRAGAHLVESGESGQTVYRLYHQSYADFLRGLSVPRATQRAVAAALIATVNHDERRLWRRANPYVLRHLSAHAVVGGQLPDLMSDAGYVIEADPDRLTKVLGEVDYQQHAHVRIYWRAVELLRSATSVADRAAILHATALRDEPALAPAFRAVADGQRCLFTIAPSRSVFRRLHGHRGAVLHVAFGRINGRPLLATAGQDAAVRVWDARSGDQLTTITEHTRAVHRVAFGEFEGATVLVTASQDRTTRVWNAETYALIGTVDGDASAFEYVDGDILTATVSLHDGSVVIRRLPDGKELSRLYPSGIAIRVALGVLGSTLCVAVATYQGTVDVWTGGAEPALSLTHSQYSSMTIATVGDRTLLAVRSEAGLRLWDLATATEVALGLEISAHGAIALGAVHGSAVLVTADGGGQRVWDLDHRRELGGRQHRGGGDPMSVALGDHYGQSIVAVGYRSGQIDLTPLDGSVTARTTAAAVSQVTCAAFGILDVPVVAYGDIDGAVTVKRVEDGTMYARRSLPGSRLLAVECLLDHGRPTLVVCTANGVLHRWTLKGTTKSRSSGTGTKADATVDAAALGVVHGALVAAARTTGPPAEPGTPQQTRNADAQRPRRTIELQVIDVATAAVLSTLRSPDVERAQALAVGALAGAPVLVLATGSTVQVLALHTWAPLWSLRSTGRRFTVVRLMAKGSAGELLAVDSSGTVFSWSPGQPQLTPIHETALLQSRLATVATAAGQLLLANADDAGISVHAVPGPSMA